MRLILQVLVGRVLGPGPCPLVPAGVSRAWQRPSVTYPLLLFLLCLPVYCAPLGVNLGANFSLAMLWLLHFLQLCVLVPACIQVLVSLVHGPVGSQSHLLGEHAQNCRSPTCWPMEAVFSDS